MELSIKREDLLQPLQLVSGAVERRQTLPILSNVLISADRDLSITATDLEVELVGRISLEQLKEGGEITVPARKFIDICRSLPNDATIHLSTDKDWLRIRSGKSRFSLTTLPAREFPNVDESSSKVEFTIPQDILKDLLLKTYFAMAQQDVRYYLNGMLLEVSKDLLRLVATDGHRLSMTTFSEIETNATKPVQVIIPRKGVVELMRLLNDDNTEVKISLGDNHICAHTASFSFTSKLIEGKFPDYDRVIPKDGDKVFHINCDALKQSLSRVAILSNEKYRGIRLLLKSGLIRIFTNNPEQEEAEEELEIDYKGAELEIGFNVNYLIDICNTVSNVKMTFSDSNSSVLIEDVNANNYLFVVMPMRL